MRGCAPVWVHNTTDSELADLRPHCGELRSSSGTVLACDVTFEPACVEQLAAAAKQSVLMRVTGVDRAAPGDVYRGIVQIAGLADTVLAVECEVTVRRSARRRSRTMNRSRRCSLRSGAMSAGSCLRRSPTASRTAGSTDWCVTTRTALARPCDRACVSPRAEPSAAATRPALPIAASIEMLHNAFLIHDDIADASERRRGAPTLPAEHGDGLALNAATRSALFAHQLLRRHLSSLPRQVADRVFDEFDTMATRTLEGQATELGWRRDRTMDLEPEDYLQLIMLKTCWYTTIHPLRVGALVGSNLLADVRPMVRFGFFLGAAFQIRDDLLNLVGEPATYGKETNGDLYEGKRTLMLIHLARNASGRERDVVKRYLEMSRTARTAAVVDEIRGLMSLHGSIEFASEYGQGIASAALGAFDEAFAAADQGPDTDFVRRLVPFVLGRHR